MRLTPGNTAPTLRESDFLGQVVDLQALKGRPVLLTFYRYASCPICNLRMRRTIEMFPTWAERGLAVISVFQSPAASISEYVGRQDAPFPIIPDPTMALYRLFGVESRWLGLVSVRVIGVALRAFSQGFLPGRVEGPLQRTPADFLIDEQGKIAVVHYGRNIDDHLDLTTITQWLNTRSA